MRTNVSKKLNIRNFRIRLFAWCCFAFFLINGNALANKGLKAFLTIQGTVTSASDGAPLIGVNILVKGTSRGAITDIDGHFEIEATPGETLVFSYVGYLAQEIQVGTSNIMNVSLEFDSNGLEEVVVVGYGRQKKSHLTGAVAKVSDEKLAQIPVSRADQALVGQLAGVQVQNVSSLPGAAPKIQVRGLSTITAGADPLIVVDGYPVPDDLSSIDMSDVESIEVLKDAASTAIYGSRGANGVILVTTKSGKAGKPKFSLSINTGLQEPFKYPHYLPSPNEWTDYVNANLSNWGLSALPKEIVAMQSLGIYTDWGKETFRTGMFQNYQLSASGGSDKVHYFISGNYTQDDGVMITNRYEKYSFRINLDAALSDKLDWGLTFNPNYSTQRDFPIGVHDIFRYQPWDPVYHTAETVAYAKAAGYDVEVGDFAHERQFSNVNGVKLTRSSDNNPVAKIYGRNTNYTYLRGFGNTYLKYNFSKYLNFKTSFGLYTLNRDREYFRTLYGHRSEQREGSLDTRRTLDWLNENLLNYKRTFGKHDIDALAGFSFQKRKILDSGIDAIDFLTDNIRTLNAGTITNASSTETKNALVSTFYRLLYAYDDKILLSGTARWDASSRFGKDNRWGFFPSVSLGWRLNKEPFLKDSRLFSELKLRTSYGVTGNNQIGDFGAIATYSPSNYVLGDNSLALGFAKDALGNDLLGWERTFEFNAGADIGLMEDRLFLVVDVFNSRTDQLLLNLDIPTVTGFSTVLVNKGKVNNKGWEISLNSRNIVKDDFSWSTRLNFSGYRNKLVNFGGTESLIVTSTDTKRPIQWYNEVGQPINQFYGYKTEAEIPTANLKNPAWPINAASQDVIVADVNGDGKITDADRTVLGSPYPDFIWGITNTFTFKGFDLSFLFQGQQGGKIINLDADYYEQQSSSYIGLSDDQKARLQDKLVTDYMLQDASFIALRNVNLGYTLPKTVAKRLHLSSARIFLSSSNPWYKTADNYKGLNPEDWNLFGSDPFRPGAQRGAYPIIRSYTAGLNVSF